MGKPAIDNKTPRPEQAHFGVCTRLAPSSIDGVGVFAIRNIKKGTDIFPEVDDEIIWINKTEVGKLHENVHALYEDYCIHKGAQYGCPVSFNRMNVSWYLNHSSKPNTAVVKGYRVYALRDIKKGEELTLDYTSFMDMKIPLDWR